MRHDLDATADRYMRRTFGYVARGLGWSMIRWNIASSHAWRELVAALPSPLRRIGR